MPRKHFIRRDDIAIDIIGADINLPMGGMLDAVNNDKTIRANRADRSAMAATFIPMPVTGDVCKIVATRVSFEIWLA